MKLLISNLIILFILNRSTAQVTFQKTFGGQGSDFGFFVQQTSDGGYIITGTASIFSGSDTYTIKTNSAGDTIWTRNLGTALAYERCYAIQETNDGGYISVGAAGIFAMTNSYLIKTDSNGDTLWTKSFGWGDEDYGSFVQQTADGGYIVAGTANSDFGIGIYGAYLVRTDSQGNILWKLFFINGNKDKASSVLETSDGGYIIGGTAYSDKFGMGSYDVSLTKTNNSGNILWSKNYGGTGDEFGTVVQITPDGGFVIVGYTESFGAGNKDVYLIKTDSIGNIQWSKTYGGTSSEYGIFVKVTTDGGYAIIGSTLSFGVGMDDVYLIKTDSLGSIQWSKTYGGVNNELGYSLDADDDGGYSIVGYTNSFGAGGNDIYLIKTDSTGNSGCNQTTPLTIEISPATMDSIISPLIFSGGYNFSTTLNLSSGGTVNTFCTSIGIQEADPGDRTLILTFPNPFYDNLSIKVQKEKVKQFSFTIKNMLGQIVYTEKENNFNSSKERTVDLHFLSNGLYLLYADIDGEHTVNKIVKE